MVLGVTAEADSPAPAKPKSAEVSRAHLTVWRKADGKKFPNDVKESYQIARDGTLEYRAYFGGMPTTMNHNDAATWKSPSVAKVIRVFDDVRLDMVFAPDDKPHPDNGEGYYLATVRDAKGDTTRYARDPKSPAWKAIDPAFQAMIAEFEKATGRPLKPGQLPQR
jgi:hypothetical protein